MIRVFTENGVYAPSGYDTYAASRKAHGLEAAVTEIWDAYQRAGGPHRRHPNTAPSNSLMFGKASVPSPDGIEEWGAFAGIVEGFLTDREDAANGYPKKRFGTSTSRHQYWCR